MTDRNDRVAPAPVRAQTLADAPAHEGDRAVAAAPVVVPGPVASVVLSELGQLRALWLLARGRTHTEGAGNLSVPYAAGWGGVYLMLAAVCLIELVAVHLVVPWHRLGALAWLQWLALALSAYALVWLLAWWAGQRTHPHLITEQELVLRNSTRVVARVPLRHVDVVAERRRGNEAGDRLVLGGLGGDTNLDVDLTEALHWRGLTGRPRRARAVSLHVDDPRLAARRVRQAADRAAASPTGLGAADE